MSNRCQVLFPQQTVEPSDKEEEYAHGIKGLVKHHDVPSTKHQISKTPRHNSMGGG